MAQKRTFETAMEDLEGVVRQLEGGSLTLDDSLAAFEKGINLARECEIKLTEAKGKIEKLITDSQGNIKTETFEVK
ncbi:MAG: exodeoxyribonuclease VII small subunit [Pseudomonadota bacterium]